MGQAEVEGGFPKPAAGRGRAGADARPLLVRRLVEALTRLDGAAHPLPP